jgi:hypothetical protein
MYVYLLGVPVTVPVRQYAFLHVGDIGIGSVADPHQKNADADLGKNLDADADSRPYCKCRICRYKYSYLCDRIKNFQT